jgi:SAM-dependent methyltransferase
VTVNPPLARAAAIESALRSHPDVKQVRMRDARSPAARQAGAAGLTAVVVPAESPAATLPPDTLVGSWQAIFSDSYETALDDADERRAALAGWTDSFTGDPIPAVEMAEWVGTTVQRILTLAPRRVLEIGAGTGLIMRPLAESASVAAYTAADVSPQAATILGRIAMQTECPGVTIRVVEAEAMGAVRLNCDRDTTVINSVAQYLPSLAYLDKLLAAAVERTPPGGHVFLGDLRNTDLLVAFATLKHHLLAGPGTPDAEVGSRISSQLQSDVELSVSPQYLRGLPVRLPRVSAVEIAPRRGMAGNEMTLFRYDAVLHVECDDSEPAVSWDRETPGLDAIDEHVGRAVSAARTAFGYRAVPNERVARAVRLFPRYGIQDQAPPPAGRPVDPEVFWRTAERHGMTARVSWHRPLPDGAFDVSFVARGSRHCTIADPVRDDGDGVAVVPPGMFAPLVAERRAAVLRDALAEKVPERDPVAVVFVPWLPADTAPLPCGMII